MPDTPEFNHLTQPPATALGPIDGVDDDGELIATDDLEGQDGVDEFIGTGADDPEA